MLRKRKPIRLKSYDYSQYGAYFVTICTHNCKKMFGDICNGKMVLNDVGKVVEECWLEIPQHFNRVKLDIYEVMPNHLHGIILINDGENIVGDNDRCTEMNCFDKRDNHGCPLRIRNMELIPKIMAQYKSSVTRKIRNNKNDNIRIWQRSFYDRVVRNEEELYRIREYVVNNPAKWEEDEYYQK